jgi:hypothetical protein
MAPDPESLRFYVDESAMGLGKTLATARRDTIHVGHRLIPECPLGVLDPEWIPIVAQRNLIVICRDKKIRTKPGELVLLREAGLRVFCIGGKRDLTTWEWLRRIVKHWDRIEDIIATRCPGPWFYLVKENTVDELAT